MIKQDAITDLVMTMARFVTKRGADISSKQDLMRAINAVVGEDSLDAIFINTTDNILIPDVAVLHLYNDKFASYLLNPDSTDLCPFGYTIEIHQRCFDKYTEEELTALILHDILQNVQSDTARTRLLRAYTTVIEKHNDTDILEMFNELNLNEVLYIMYASICTRPFKAPVVGCDYVGTDEVLKSMGLGDAYDSYLEKILPVSTDTPEDRIDKDLKDDLRDVNTIINSCLDNDIRHYYHTISTNIPLISLQQVFSGTNALHSIGFYSRHRDYKRRDSFTDNANSCATVMVESYNNPKNEIEIRWQIDKIINSMRYAESEAERNVVLFKIKELSLKLSKMEEKLSRRPGNDPYMAERIRKIREFQDELEQLRRKTVAMEIKTKHWHIYVKDAMPSGYDF